MTVPKCPPGKCDLWISDRRFLWGKEAMIMACLRCHYVTTAVMDA